jgi:hypothetical protein
MGLDVSIDGQTVSASLKSLQRTGGQLRALELDKGYWRLEDPAPRSVAKVPDLQGPIDDAFMEPFVVVPQTAAPVPVCARLSTSVNSEYTVRRWRRCSAAICRCEKSPS